MLVVDLLGALDRAAPFSLAEPGDNCGLLVGDEQARVCRVLASLELTEPVLEEALAGGYDTVLTHHPLLFSPVRSLVESDARESLLRRLVAEHMTLVACHTNLDAAQGGLAEIAAEALGLQQAAPLQCAEAGWYKLVGFIPEDAVETLAAAVFAAGAGRIGLYDECAFATSGTGWFAARPGSHPTVGEVLRPERTPEVRWETVVPKGRLTAVIQAFVDSHPYEEPAFDIYPVEDVMPRAGLGRVGSLAERVPVRSLAERAAELFGVSAVSWSGDGERLVRRVGVLPGSGRSLLDAARGQCEVLLTGDVGYHAADMAAEMGVSLIDLPHGEFEWWAFRRWAEEFGQGLRERGVTLAVSTQWRSPWQQVGQASDRSRGGAEKEETVREAAGSSAIAVVRVRIDGGSRGNPGPSAIGVVVEDEKGAELRTVSRAIGEGTNNVAEYRALLAGLEIAAQVGAKSLEVVSDSELLVRQMRGEYKVKNEGLKPLHAEARERAAGFARFAIRHVPREENARADELVNLALDEQEKTGL